MNTHGIPSFVIQRTSDDKYVSRPGMEHSYTEHLEDARLFASHDEARREYCVENERILQRNRAA